MAKIEITSLIPGPTTRGYLKIVTTVAGLLAKLANKIFSARYLVAPYSDAGDGCCSTLKGALSSGPKTLSVESNKKCVTKLTEEYGLWHNNTYGIIEIQSMSDLIYKWDLKIIRKDDYKKGILVGISSTITPGTDFEDTLNEDIATWLPYIIIDAIDVDRHIDAHTIEITLSIRVTEQGANTQIKLLIDSDGIQVNELVL